MESHTEDHLSNNADAAAGPPTNHEDDGEEEVEQEEEDGMGGSLSHLYLDLKGCLLYRQVEVTTRTQAKQQITLLQVVP